MSKKRYTHIIWDWNGTLLDDVEICVATVNELLAKRRLPYLTIERYRESVDFPIIEFYRKLGFKFEDETYDQVAEEYNRLYLAQLKDFRLHAGARQSLARLGQAGISHSILSAYQQQKLELVVEHMQLRQWFTELVGTRDSYAHGKIEYGKQMIRNSPYNPATVLFVGDMKHDYEVARTIDIDCVLLTCGHQSRSQLAGCNVPLFDSLQELVQWIEPAAGEPPRLSG